MLQLVIVLLIIVIPSLIYLWMKKTVWSGGRLKYSDYEKRIDQYTLRIEFNPQDAHAYYERGKAHLKLGNKNEALEDLKLAGIHGYSKAYEIIEFNNLQQLNDNHIFQVDSNISWEIDQNKFIEYKDSLDDLNREIKSNPKNSLAYFMRANIKEIYKDHAGAIDDLTSAIKNNNKFAEAYYKRGIVKFNLSDSEGARMDLEKANSLGFTKASVFLKKKYNMNESTILN